MDGSTSGSDPEREVDLDPPAEGLDRYVETPSDRRNFPWTPFLLGCVVILLVGAGAVVLGQRANRRVDGPALTPASPIDGKATKRHPVRVTPDTGLVDGQQVTVTGSEFPPNADIGVVMCTNAAATIGVDACDISTSSFLAGQQIRTTSDGTFSLQYTVRTHFRIKDPNAPAPTPAGPSGPTVCTDDGVTTTCSAGPLPPATSIESFTPGKDGAVDMVQCEVLADGTKQCTSSPFIPAPDPLAGTMEVDCLTGNVDPGQWALRVEAEGEQQAVATDPGAFTCLVAAGLITDYDESGGWPVAFEGEVFMTPPSSATTVPATTVPTTDTTAGDPTAPSTTDPTTASVPTTAPPPVPTSIPLPYPHSTPPASVTVDPAAPDCTPVTVPGQVSGPTIPQGCIPQPGAPPP